MRLDLRRIEGSAEEVAQKLLELSKAGTIPEMSWNIKEGDLAELFPFREDTEQRVVAFYFGGGRSGRVVGEHAR